MAKKQVKKASARRGGNAKAASKVAKKAKVATKKKATKKKPAKPIDQDAMMAAWQTAMTPSDGHRRLEPMVGSWKAVTTMVMMPGAPPETSEGTSENRWVLGGRYLEQRYRGSSMGMPFEGFGVTAYDNVQRKYLGTWIDSFGTGVMNSVGVGRPTDEAMDSVATSVDPWGKPVRFECKVRIEDRNRHSFEMWTKAPNGKRFRMMFIEYARA